MVLEAACWAYLVEIDLRMIKGVDHRLLEIILDMCISESLGSRCWIIGTL